MKKTFSVFFALFLSVLYFSSCGDSTSVKADGEPSHSVDTLYVIQRDTIYSMDTLVMRDSIYSFIQNDASCKIEDAGALVTVTCDDREMQLFKATCGNEGFDPSVSFCYGSMVFDFATADSCGKKIYDKNKAFCDGNSVFSQCSGMVYDPMKYICINDSLYPICGKSRYNPEDQFCVGGDIYKKCNGETYDVDVYGCSLDKERKDILVELCGGRIYDESIEFCVTQCEMNFVAEKCNGKSYDYLHYSCVDGTLLKRCLRDDEDACFDFREADVYDTTTHFCNEFRIWELCEGKTYTPKSMACVDGAVKGVCHAIAKDIYYDMSTEFCAERPNSFGDNYIYPKCNGDEYDVATRVCLDGVLYGLCGYNIYDFSESFCAGRGLVLPLCAGSEYNVENQRCQDELIVDICGSSNIDLDTHFCADGESYEKCNGQTYDVKSQICQDGVVLKFCGSEPMDSVTHFCVDGVPYEKCGGKEYDVNWSICRNDVVVDVCNSIVYDSSTHFCYKKELFEKCGGFAYDPSFEACKEGHIESFCLECLIEPNAVGSFVDERDNRLYYTRKKTSGVEYMIQDLLYETKQSFLELRNDIGSSYSASRTYLWEYVMDPDHPERYAENRAPYLIYEFHRGVCPKGWHVPHYVEIGQMNGDRSYGYAIGPCYFTTNFMEIGDANPDRLMVYFRNFDNENGGFGEYVYKGVEVERKNFRAAVRCFRDNVL